MFRIAFSWLHFTPYFLPLHCLILWVHYNQRVVASEDRQWPDGGVVILEGRPLNIEWYDGESLWVSAHNDKEPGDVADAARSTPLRYLSTRQTLSYELARRLSLQVALSLSVAPLVQCEDGWLWFHWLGDVYGQALLDLLAYTLPVEATPQMGLCLLFRSEPRAIPSFTLEQVRRYLHDRYRLYEPMLALGVYHYMLSRN